MPLRQKTTKSRT